MLLLFRALNLSIKEGCGWAVELELDALEGTLVLLFALNFGFSFCCSACTICAS